MSRTVRAAAGGGTPVALAIARCRDQRLPRDAGRLAPGSSTFDLGETLRGHRHDSVLSTTRSSAGSVGIRRKEERRPLHRRERRDDGLAKDTQSFVIRHTFAKGKPTRSLCPVQVCPRQPQLHGYSRRRTA